MKNEKLIKKIILILLFIFGFGVRLWKINTPLADWHSWRQADTASVAHFFVQDGYNLLKPKYHDLSSVPSGLDNPEGLRFVEFPLYNAAHAFIFKLASSLKVTSLSFNAVGRLVSIFSWLITGWFLYCLAKKGKQEKVGLWSLFFFLFIPYNIFYSRTILPEPMMLALALASIFFLTKEKMLLAVTLGALSLLVKPYALFILFPSWLIIFWQVGKKNKFLLPACYLLLTTLPFAAWRFWISHFPEGIPSSGWLFNDSGIRFRPAWWRWLFGERLGRLILGHWGTALLILGLTRKIKKETVLFWSWLIGGFAFLAVFAQGNVQHDYYQILLSPALAIFLGLGANFLFNFPFKLLGERIKVKALTLGLVGFTLAFSWYFVKDYYSINRPEIVEAGDKVNEILPLEAKVIAPYAGDTAFLYQTKRRGWPIITRSLEETIKKGATHYVAVDYDHVTNEAINRCQILFEDQDKRYVIVDLQNCTPKEK